jgi:membrane protease YdiL (CAAX protease family)
MISPALLLPRGLDRDLILLLDAAFVAYVVFSFVRVAAYTRRQVRSGQLIDGPDAPPRFAVSGVAGGSFVLCVLVLLFSQSALYLILVTAGVACLLVAADRDPEKQFGLRRLSLATLLQWSFLVCGAVIFIELPLGWLLDRAFTALHFSHPEQESVQLFRRLATPGQIGGFLLVAVVISPLIEELFFRGFLFTFLKNYTNTRFALVLSAGIFAFAHVNLGAVLPLWILGLILGLAYEHTGSLPLAFGIHACWNLLTAAGLLLEKGGS